jgi:hypothetical protein
MSTVVTGQDFTLVVGGVTYTPQTLSATLTVEDNQEQYDVLGARVYKTLTVPYTLEVEILSDWGKTGGICNALATATLAAPDTSLLFTMTATGPDATLTVTGNVFPKVPPASGAGFEASQISWTFTGDRNTAVAFASA